MLIYACTILCFAYIHIGFALLFTFSIWLSARPKHIMLICFVVFDDFGYIFSLHFNVFNPFHFCFRMSNNAFVLQVCHKHGVMHRDLKPENFLFTNKKETAPLKAIDFGLSVFFKPGNLLSLTTAYYIVLMVSSIGCPFKSH